MKELPISDSTVQQDGKEQSVSEQSALINDEDDNGVNDDETDTCQYNNVVLFLDNLLQYLRKTKDSKKEKAKYIWDGDLDDLEAFTTLVLKMKGKWTGPTKRSPGKLVFKEQKGQITLNWWKTKHTLQPQGKPDEIAKFHEILDKLINGKDEHQTPQTNHTLKPTTEDPDAEEISDTVNTPQTGKCKDKVTKKQTKDKDKKEKDLEKIWKAIDELKTSIKDLTREATGHFALKSYENSPANSTSNITSNMSTPTRSTPTQVNLTKKVAIIQPVITKYFNRITRKEMETLNQVVQINKFNEIMRRNKELEREVRTLQDRLNTLTTENKELRNNLNTR